jgi:hypothetical protein
LRTKKTKQPVECGTFTPTTYAQFVGRSMAAVLRDHQLGRMPAGFKIGANRYWLRAEILAWIEAGSPPRDKWEVLKATK